MIRYDAYPAAAGIDVIELVKTTDLEALFGCMEEYDPFVVPEDGDPCDEPQAFSFALCRKAVKTRGKIYVHRKGIFFIQQSLFCEYGYVLDLDTDELLFFTGGHTEPQEGDEYGNTPLNALGE